MQMRALVMALTAMGMLAPGLAQAELDNLKEELPNLRPENNCAMMAFYGGTQVCRWLSNGLTQCQPVGMLGPSPDCPNAGQQPLIPVPLAPPAIQPPGLAANPYIHGAAVPVGQPFIWPFGQASAPSPFPSPFPAPLPVNAQQPVTLPQIAPLPWPLFPTTPTVAAAPGTSGTAGAAAQPVTTRAPALPSTPAPASQPVATTLAQAQPSGVPAATLPAAPTPAAPTPAAPTPAVTPLAAPTPPAASSAPTSPAPMTAGQAAPRAEPPVAPGSLTLTGGPTLEDALAHFDFDSSKLTNRGRARIDAWLVQYPRDIPVLVTGHTDRLGPRNYNLKLSKRRAETVRQYLLEKGVDAKQIEVRAKGESEPVKFCKGSATPATKACLAPNRRVVIALD